MSHANDILQKQVDDLNAGLPGITYSVHSRSYLCHRLLQHELVNTMT